MSMTEIILLIVAIAFLIISFFVVSKDQGSNSTNKPELTQEDIDKMKHQIKDLIEDAVSNGVIEAEDKMSKISNEKIMAVNDYSLQLLDRIEQNNKDVVFLYDMLCQKDSDIKVTYQKMETIRRENKEFLEKLTLLMANKSKQKDNIAKSDTGSKTQEQVSHTKQDTDGFKDNTEETINKKLVDSMSKAEFNTAEDHEEKVEANVSNQKENILSLHKLNMSVLEISKQLGIGQGEVKLVIDLYAKKN